MSTDVAQFVADCHARRESLAAALMERTRETHMDERTPGAAGADGLHGPSPDDRLDQPTAEHPQAWDPATMVVAVIRAQAVLSEALAAYEDNHTHHVDR